MDRLTQRLGLARRVLAQLDELMDRPLTPIERDAWFDRIAQRLAAPPA